MRSIDPAPNVAEEKRTKALLRRLGFFGGQAATAASDLRSARKLYVETVEKASVNHKGSTI
jgi:hypothetical protein